MEGYGTERWAGARSGQAVKATARNLTLLYSKGDMDPGKGFKQNNLELAVLGKISQAVTMQRKDWKAKDQRQENQ